MRMNRNHRGFVGRDAMWGGFGWAVFDVTDPAQRVEDVGILGDGGLIVWAFLESACAHTTPLKVWVLLS